MGPAPVVEHIWQVAVEGEDEVHNALRRHAGKRPLIDSVPLDRALPAPVLSHGVASHAGPLQGLAHTESPQRGTEQRLRVVGLEDKAGRAVRHRSASPPTRRTTGIAPYRWARIWVRPQGSY